MKLKGVMISAGYFAGIQAEAWNRIPEAEIVAVADLISGKAKAFADKFHFPRAYESAEEMLDQEKPYFVDVATRPESHLALVMAAAQRGIHVICQKPMAPTWDECVAMVEICEAAKVRLVIHENWRWHPWYRETKRLLVAGRLGQPFHIAFQWRTGDGRGPEPYAQQPYFLQMPRLLVYEALVHTLDTFRFLFGEVKSVFCQNRRINPVLIGEDQSLIQLSFANGGLGLIDANRFSGPVPAPLAMGTMIIDGESATLRLSPDGRLWLSDAGQSETPHDFSIPTAGYRGDSVRATQAHLIDCLCTGKPSESEGRDYLKTVALVEACYESDKAGQLVSPRL